MHIQRHAEETIHELSKKFSAVLVTGSRQSGKTTLLRRAVPEAKWISMDDLLLLASLREGNASFLKDKPPLFLDELQHALKLLPQISAMLGQEGEKGQLYLAGARQTQMIQDVVETLAGRVGLLTLPGVSLREELGVPVRDPFIPIVEYYKARRGALPEVSHDDVWRIIHRGRMPALVADKGLDCREFYSNYVRTYIERDLRQLSQAGDEVKFARFMAGAAARTAGLLNLAEIAREVGITHPTAERWLAALEASNIIHLLRPYPAPGTNRRTVKAPKLYFLDTGLAAYLTQQPSPEALRDGPLAGAFFESWVFSEIITGYHNAGVLNPPLWFYRDSHLTKIDLMIERSGSIHPINIMIHITPETVDMGAFGVIDKVLGPKRGEGGVICLCDELDTLKGWDKVIPVRYL